MFVRFCDKFLEEFLLLIVLISSPNKGIEKYWLGEGKLSYTKGSFGGRVEKWEYRKWRRNRKVGG